MTEFIRIASVYIVSASATLQKNSKCGGGVVEDFYCIGIREEDERLLRETTANNLHARAND